MFEEVPTQQKTNFVSRIVFIATFITASISMVSVIFPFLLVRIASSVQDNSINIFELGIWSIPIFIVNGLLIMAIILHRKGEMPLQWEEKIRSIFKFEVSPKTALIVVLFLLAIFIGFSARNILVEDPWADYVDIKPPSILWSFDQGKGIVFSFNFFLNHYSLVIFQNMRVIPFLTSIALLVVTYLLTVKISGKRFSGLVAMAIVLQSNLFWTYNSSPTYPNYWILLYLVSLYLIYKSWTLSPISYVFSALAKGLSLVFLPLSFFFIYRMQNTTRTKIKIALPYMGITVLFGVLFMVPQFQGFFPYSGFNFHSFVNGFTALPYQLRYDGLVLIFLLPVTVGLYKKSRDGFVACDSALVLITGALLSSPLLVGMTWITLEPYREISLILFFAIGVGCLLSKRPTLKV